VSAAPFFQIMAITFLYTPTACRGGDKRHETPNIYRNIDGSNGRICGAAVMGC
jgi:hypothetical protein